MIHIRGLRKVFPPDKLALAGLDLDIAAGEFVMIIGQSGAGKTTLLRCL
ncbi:MAG: ATP-binding cassette domain-containing protein, partial [candidate division NC10 bacterium]|nr:ATP-binding cassette domain-containing protein [candidate division NC10 bacterium]